MLFPYVGITDFTDFKQVLAMLEVFKKHKPQGSKRQLHVGVMTSYKRFMGFPTKWVLASPPKESHPKIFNSTETYNCLHYADYHNNPGLAQTLSLVIENSGFLIHAIQLDMVWPNPQEVWDGVDRSRRYPEVILQVGRKALDAVGNNPQRLVEKLDEYKGVIHRVLLDKSGGEGRGLNAYELLPFARVIAEKFPKLKLVVAGGLGPNTMHLVEPIVKEFPNVSIDAQGRLRPSGNAMDPVDWNMAKEYLVKALKVLN